MVGSVRNKPKGKRRLFRVKWWSCDEDDLGFERYFGNWEETRLVASQLVSEGKETEVTAVIVKPYAKAVDLLNKCNFIESFHLIPKARWMDVEQRRDLAGIGHGSDAGNARVPSLPTSALPASTESEDY